jgi:PAS domain S-box-containing protein
MPDKVLEVFCYKLPSAEVVILFNDISNRIAMEKALRDSQKNYKILFNNANDSIFIHDLDGNFINVNRIACKKLGYSKSELMRKTPGEIDSPKYRKLITERFANLMENGKISFETEQIRKDGKHIPVDMESRLIKYKDKIAVLSTARDITERKIVEEKLNYELHLNKAISRLAEELLSNKSTVTDMASRVLQYALEITNSKQGFIAEINEEYPGNTAKIIAMVAEGCMLENNSEQEKTAEHVCLNDLVLKTRKSFFTNNPENHPAYKGNKPDGHFSINNFLAVPALINDQIIGQIAIANTSKKYSEADTDAIERIANLYALTIQMEGSRNELEVRNSELNNFVYKVSHDLRAPLASIAGLVNVIRLLALDEQAKSYIDLIDNRIQKLDRFIQDILSHSRNLNTNLNYEKIDLKKLVADVIAELNYMPEARDVKVVLDIDNHDFYSDRLRMKEILRNLISNGFKYHNPYADNKNIRIASRIDYNKASIMYQDNGSGIEKMIMPKIFDMFYKGSDKSNSSGLGLYIVKQAVDKLKGTIEVESSVGTGTRFSIDIPNHIIT